MLIRPVITAWKARHPSVSGHEGQYAMREIVNAILYQTRTGCQWRYLPHDLPPKSAVYYYFAKWRDDGTAETIHDLLRWQVRESRKRHEDPTAVVMDSQTVRASMNAPKETTGLDPGKRSPGRKRGIATDVLGLVIAAVVVAASVHGNAIGIALLDKVVARAPTVTKAWVDAGFKNAVVEQRLGTLMLHRRLARDYEARPASSVAMIHWSMTDVMLRRLTHTCTPTWHDPPAWHAAPPNQRERR